MTFTLTREIETTAGVYEVAIEYAIESNAPMPGHSVSQLGWTATAMPAERQREAAIEAIPDSDFFADANEQARDAEAERGDWLYQMQKESA